MRRQPNRQEDEQDLLALRLMDSGASAPLAASLSGASLSRLRKVLAAMWEPQP